MYSFDPVFQVNLEVLYHFPKARVVFVATRNLPIRGCIHSLPINTCSQTNEQNRSHGSKKQCTQTQKGEKLAALQQPVVRSRVGSRGERAIVQRLSFKKKKHSSDARVLQGARLQ